ncbi:unnamed protein product [Cyprideis torosa]|uniref:Uncharacterized protein n=1 Tax=Cyprideis torosa TaxID=163714 RepID=A0A7R8ZPX6_9CRUS|nr:unnamed protein product [Cyprideis torosa]CAG0899967.1 unnamed protein product [Cyprideis torosa]
MMTFIILVSRKGEGEIKHEGAVRRRKRDVIPVLTAEGVLWTRNLAWVTASLLNKSKDSQLLSRVRLAWVTASLPNKFKDSQLLSRVRLAWVTASLPNKFKDSQLLLSCVRLSRRGKKNANRPTGRPLLLIKIPCQGRHQTGSAKATPGPPGISTFNQVRLRTRVTRRVLQCIMVSGATVVFFGVLLACLGYFVLSGTNPLRLIGPCVIGCGFMILLLAVEVCARGRHDFMGYDVQILTGVNEDNAMEWTAQEVEELKLALETFTVFPHGSLSSGSKHSSGSSKRSQPSNRLNNGTNLKGSTARKDPQSATRLPKASRAHAASPSDF